LLVHLQKFTSEIYYGAVVVFVVENCCQSSLPWRQRFISCKVTDFSSDASIEDYKNLKLNLEKDFSEIFQKCTMKGESHNQLHNYLKPMLPMFDAFESEDASIRSSNLSKMKRHLSGYTNYFE